MTNTNLEKSLKGRRFNGLRYSRIQRIREEPRHKIRQLLRSFEPLTSPESEAQTGNENQY